MSWPRSNEGIRVYQEKANKSFVLVIVEHAGGENGLNRSGNYDVIANVFEGSNPSLATTSASPLFLLNRCRRVQWSDLPKEWQVAFRRWFEDDWEPEEVRGLWKMNQMPVTA